MGVDAHEGGDTGIANVRRLEELTERHEEPRERERSGGEGALERRRRDMVKVLA